MDDLRKLRVLLVDADAELLRGNARVLERAGFATQAASSGEQALGIMRAGDCDLVLVDWDMPGMDGLEVCRRIKAEPALADLMVIIMSGIHTQSEEQADGLSSGADGFIARPVGDRELVARIEAFGRIWRLGHALREKNIELQALTASMAQRRAAEINLLEDAVTSQKKAETSLAALHESEEIFTHFMDNSPIYVFFKDENIRSIRLSRNYETMLGRPLPELLGKSMDELFPSDLAKKMVADDMRVLREGKTVSVEEEFDERFYTTIKFPILIAGTPRYLAGYTIDITERRAAEAKIARLTSLYAALSSCNEAIVRCSSEAELFAEICRVAVELGGMKLAWIGLIDPLAQTIRVASSFGSTAEEYLKHIDISADSDSPIGHGPTGMALRDGRQVWCQDFQNDPLTEPWHELAARVGFRSSSALPLYRDGAVVGALMLYSGTIDAFDQSARELLFQMASDISFALDNFAREASGEKARADLRVAETQFRGMIEQNMTGVYIAQEGRIVYVNQRLCEMLGWKPEALMGKDTFELLGQAPESQEKIVHERARIESGAGNVLLTLPFIRPDGTAITLEISASTASQNGRTSMVCMVQDVSEKQRAEQEIRQYLAELEVAFMSSVEVATRLGELRDPYTAGHQRRVSDIAAAIGAELGWDERRREGLRVAGYLHDVGQITVPAEVLAKPGELSPIAYQLVQGHAQAGYDVLKGVKFPWPVAEVALQHHERMDGSGYPQCLKGDEILLEARVMAVADVIEAMASHRPYRAALGLARALEEITRGRAPRYDGAVVDACLRLFQEKGYSIPA